MARMHSRDKGVSGSKKPVKKVVPSWVRYKPAEVEAIIVKSAKEGMPPSQIGMMLRDTYGIPDVKTLVGKSITGVLKAKDIPLELPEDLRALIRRAAMLRKHMEENKQDNVGKRGLQLTESKIKRLVKYYKDNEVLDVEWKYDPRRISMYLD